MKAYFLTAPLALLAGLLIAVAPAAQAASASPLPTQNRAASGFEAIAVAGDINILVRQGTSESVQVQAEERLLPLVETFVEARSGGRTLVIRYQRGQNIGHHKPVQVTVGVIHLGSISSAGSGDVIVETLKTPALKLSLAGASDARLQALNTESLELHIAGSADVQARGHAGKLHLHIAGSGDADLAALVADDVSVSIAGSGGAEVTANRALEVSVAGSGDVSYGGAVTTVKSSVIGSGSIERR